MPQDNEQQLLRWGIANAQPGSLVPLAEDIQAGRRPDLNTDVLKTIMGESDADRMKKCMAVIENRCVDSSGNPVEPTKEDVLLAWDDLNMLIEDLNNANDLKNMGLWPPIIKHLTDADDDIVCQACWTCGTAVQNNPPSQEAFLSHDPLPTILSILTSTTASEKTRIKAMYCLSSTLKHNNDAVDRFSSLDGWSTLDRCLRDSSNVLRSKTAFLLSTLALHVPAPTVATLRSSPLLPTLLDSLSPSSAVPTGPNGETDSIDPDYLEKALRVFVNLSEREPDSTGVAELLSDDERSKLTKVTDDVKDPEDVGLAQEEWDLFLRKLKA